ncbi:MAG: hypothetical protein HY459_03690 [Parcubacteria group bacterium]|nr:hypothetical protein [Parcubacteria group bacterium]
MAKGKKEQKVPQVDPEFVKLAVKLRFFEPEQQRRIIRLFRTTPGSPEEARLAREIEEFAQEARKRSKRSSSSR